MVYHKRNPTKWYAISNLWKIICCLMLWTFSIFCNIVYLLHSYHNKRIQSAAAKKLQKMRKHKGSNTTRNPHRKIIAVTVMVSDSGSSLMNLRPPKSDKVECGTQARVYTESRCCQYENIDSMGLFDSPTYGPQEDGDVSLQIEEVPALPSADSGEAGDSGANTLNPEPDETTSTSQLHPVESVIAKIEDLIKDANTSMTSDIPVVPTRTDPENVPADVAAAIRLMAWKQVNIKSVKRTLNNKK